jgi:cytoskeletal protein CcmA (bactofilin family)
MKKFSLILILSLLIFPLSASAASFQADEKLVVNQAVSDDAYIAGETVLISENVDGDLFVGAGDVVVSANVSEDLFIAGGNVMIEGTIGGDVRLLGGNVAINGSVGGDLLLAGGDIVLGQGSRISGDMIVGGGRIRMSGAVNGNVLGGAGDILLNGPIQGDVRLFNVETLTVGPNASVNGNFKYKSPRANENLPNVVRGEIQYKEKKVTPSKDWEPQKLLAGFSVYGLLALLFIGLFLIWFFRYFGFQVASVAYESPLKSLGVGLLILILTPIVFAILLVTIIGIPAALILIVSWIILLYIGKVYASVIIGFKLLRIDEKSGFWRSYGSFALGALVFTAIGFIPFIGFIAKCLLVLVAIGAMCLYKIDLLSQLNKKKLI